MQQPSTSVKSAGASLGKQGLHFGPAVVSQEAT